MKIITGIFDNGVLQRSKNNKSEQIFEAESSFCGTLTLSVFKKGKTLRGFKKLKIASVSAPVFKAVLKGIPAGGPYDLSFSITDKDSNILDSLDVKNVLVGDLWIAAGQSNMQGVGWLDDRMPPLDNVRAYYMNNKWAVAEDPIHNLWNASAPVHGGNPDAVIVNEPTGTGPAVAFGQAMFKALKVPQGLIACAHGGTKMREWDPALKKDGDNSFYGASINRLKRLGGKVAGIIWYQGCSDTNATENIEKYTERTIELVRSFREDAGNPELPFVMVQIARFTGQGRDEARWSYIREQQYLLPSLIKNLYLVSSLDLELDDPIHLSGKSQNILGSRIADAMMCFYDRKYINPIELDSVKTASAKYYRTIELKFKNIVGKLSSDGRPTGFELHAIKNLPHFKASAGWLAETAEALSPDAVKVYPLKTELKDDTVIIYPGIDFNMLGNYEIVYGYGLNPYCNIKDSKGRPLPAFRTSVPMPSGIISEFLKEAEVSETPVYAKETEGNLVYRNDMKFIKISGGPSLKHPRRVELATKEEKILYFRAFVKFPEDGLAVIMSGYDGAVKIFVDGIEVFKDMNASNPIGYDKSFIKYRFPKGIHEIMIAEASMQGAAWGVSLRLSLLEYNGKELPSFVKSK